MTVVASHWKSQQSRSQSDAQELFQRATTENPRIHWSCWGGRIRTSDWLIQSSSNDEIGQNSVLNGRGGQARS